MKYIFFTLFLMNLVSCSVPVSVAPEFFRYELSGEFDGRKFTFTQNIKCTLREDFSEADGKFHKKWYINGGGVGQVGQLDESLYILYDVLGCPDQNYVGGVRGTVDSVVNPRVLQLFRGNRFDPRIRILTDRYTSIASVPDRLGVESSQVELMKSLGLNNSGFQMVQVRFFPYEVFSSTEQSKKYFDSLAELTIGAVPLNIPDWYVMPYEKDRDYSKFRNSKEFLMRTVLRFDGAEFVFDEKVGLSVDTYYSTPQSREERKKWVDPVAIVRYKGQRLQVKKSLEIYDPKIKKIVVFYNDFRKELR